MQDGRLIDASALVRSRLALKGQATEGALERPVAGMSVLSDLRSDLGIVPPEPMTIVSLQQIYIDGSISASRGVPNTGKTSLGVDGQIAFTLATIERAWGEPAVGTLHRPRLKSTTSVQATSTLAF